MAKEAAERIALSEEEVQEGAVTGLVAIAQSDAAASARYREAARRRLMDRMRAVCEDTKAATEVLAMPRQQARAVRDGG